MFEAILMAFGLSGWVVQVKNDMLSNTPTAIALVQQDGARIGMFCDAGTNYETAIVIQRSEISALPRIGSTFVTYRFDDDRERSAHWQNGNSDSVSINNGAEKQSFISHIKSSKELRFRARANNLASIDMLFDLTANRQKLDEFFMACKKL